MKKITVRLSGPAGTGMMQAGENLARAFNKAGYFSLVYQEYPSRIRGGDNAVMVTAAVQPVWTTEEKADLVFGMSKKAASLHAEEIRDKGLIYDLESSGIAEAAKSGGNDLARNTAAVAFIWAVIGQKKENMVQVVEEVFTHKEEYLKINREMVEVGYDLGAKEIRKFDLEASDNKETIVSMTGNEALEKGAVAADLQFAAIYPMTPINSIANMLTTEKQVTLFRPEDEIAGIMAATGASYAGKRSMVATSGGGFSLMVEGLGLSGMAEIPLVVILGQRTGPSSGMATFTSQADLQFAISAGHGEFPRIVLAPGDVTELYELTAEAFNLADKYQLPVILMTDKYLAEGRFSVTKKEFEGVKIKNDYGKMATGEEVRNYKRYKITSDGVSPRAFPGQAAVFANSYEHDEEGFSSDEAKNRQMMMFKRDQKLQGFDLDGGVTFYGSEEANTTLVTWGSTKGVALEMLKKFDDVNLVHIWQPWPFPKEAEEALLRAGRIFVVENNYSGQMATLIEQNTGRKTERITKDDGRPFTEEELEGKLKQAGVGTENLLGEAQIELFEGKIIIDPDEEVQ